MQERKFCVFDWAGKDAKAKNVLSIKFCRKQWAFDAAEIS